MKKLPIKCPNCENQLFVSQLSCPSCETNISGNYSLPILLQLSSEEQDFIFEFILSSGSLIKLPVFNVNGVINKATNDLNKFSNPELLNQISSSSLLILSLFGIITILLPIWYISLLFKGFKVASNAKGKVSTILFIISPLLAEILSKFLIFQLN